MCHGKPWATRGLLLEYPLGVQRGFVLAMKMPFGQQYRYTHARYLLLCLTIAAILMWTTGGNAQQGSGVAQARAECSVPALNFWSPPDTESGFVDVEVDFYLLDVVAIDDHRNRFTLDFTLVLWWSDPRLDDLAGGEEACKTLLEKIWHPHMIFVNSGEGASDYDGLVEIFGGGRVAYTKRFTREFAADLDLRKFPYDKQELVVNLTSMLYGPSDVRFVPKNDGAGALDGASIAGWQITGVKSLVPEQPIMARTTSHSSLHLIVGVEREHGYYLWRLVFPLIMITLMAWSVFWLEPSQLAPQVTVATGAIFSLMTFLISQGQILPKVSYISIADWLIVASVSLVFVAFGEAVLTGTLSQRGHVELARKIDRIGRWVYLAIVVLLVVFLI